ncbi:MAG: hypothetical protein ACOX15_09355 [Tepidanaerobacteraceae bacterium]
MKQTELCSIKYKLTSDSEIAKEKSVVAVIEGDERLGHFAYDTM